MLPCIIFDIDGTLANNQQRLCYLEEDPKNWKAYHAGAHRDRPIDPLCHLVRFLELSPVRQGCPILYMTGRPESSRTVTIQWLFKHIYEPMGVLKFYDLQGRARMKNMIDSVLYMRPDGDHRPDTEVKQALLDTIHSENLHPLFVVEDRKRVVEMWRAKGILCLQAAEGDF